VPEVWLFKNKQLTIYGLQGDRYIIQTHSRYFPDINISEVINDSFRPAYERNSSFAIRELRRKLSQKHQ
jgi:hypothetical protein